MVWRHVQSGILVKEEYQLFEGNLELAVQVLHETERISEVRMLVPLLQSNGATTSSIELGEDSAAVTYLGCQYVVSFQPGLDSSLGSPIANRNGIYQPLLIEANGNSISIRLSLSSE